MATLTLQSIYHQGPRSAGHSLPLPSKIFCSKAWEVLCFLCKVSYAFNSELLRRLKNSVSALYCIFFAKTYRRSSDIHDKDIMEGFLSESNFDKVRAHFIERAFFRFFYGMSKTMSNSEIGEIKDLVKVVLSRMDGLNGRMERMGERIGHLERDMSERIGRLERTVGAIESFPVPYGRAKSYYSATSMHSVSGAVRRRQSYAG